MEKVTAVAKLRHLRISPRKVRLVIGLIRGMKVTDAITQLELSKKSASRTVLKLLNSAIANAKHNHNLKENTLIIKVATVDEGVTLHRWMPRAMGRATPIRKRSCHVVLTLEGDVEEKSKKKAVKDEEKKDEAKKDEKEDKNKKKVVKAKVDNIKKE